MGGPGETPASGDTGASYGSSSGPLAWMAHNSVAANLLMLVLVVGGLLTTGRIRQQVFPDFELDVISVSVAYPGASPEEVEQGIILPLEEAVRGVDGIKEVRSSANEGLASVTCELLLGADADKALADVKSAVDRITSFPLDAEEPIVNRPQLRNKVITVIAFGDASEANLRHLAEDVREDLLAFPNITTVELTGIRPLEIAVEIPQENVRRYGLTHTDVANAIRSASIDLPAGAVRTRRGEVLLRTTERRDFGAEFNDIVVRSNPDGTRVTVADVGQVIDGFAEVDLKALYEGQPAVLVDVYRVGEQTPLDIAATVKEYVAEQEPQLPAGVHFATWRDRSELFADRVDLLRRNAILGLILVLLCLGLFLEIRLAFWVTLGIPISFTGALLFMPLAGGSINMISLFAFILTLGMVVDDAIVVGEAIYTKTTQGITGMRAAVEGVREVSAPVIFSILTSCIFFAPLLFVPGTMGKFFMQIPIVVILVLLISLVESLLVLPAHLGHNSGRITPVWWFATAGVGLLMRLLASWPWLSRGQQRFSRLVEWLIQYTYAPTLRVALRHRYLTAAVCVAILIGAVGLVMGGRVQMTFFPKVEVDIVSAELTMPFGTPVEETERVQRDMLAASDRVLTRLSPNGDVARGRFAIVGGFGGGGGDAQSGSHLAEVAVNLVPTDERPFSARQFADAWREELGDIPGVETISFRYSTGAGGGADIAFELSHPDLDVLERAAAQLAEGLARYAGAEDINDGFSAGKEQLDFTLTPAARAMGITETLLARQVRDAFFGAEAVRQQRGRDELRVYVRRPLDERQSLADLERFVVRSPDGGEIPLSEAAEIRRNRSYTSIRRLDGRRQVNVTAEVAAGANAGRIVSLANAELVPEVQAAFPDLSIARGGQQRSQDEALSALRDGMILAFFAMYALMAIAFRSYIQPLIVATAIPFGVVGAIGGHALMQYDISLMSFMGGVALSGVVVNDSLIMVSAINGYRAEGMDVFSAVTAGGTRRFRPILLTSLTTFFGLTPMILETSVGARFLIPMAVSLGFGVLFATFITLVLVPSLYLMTEDAKWLGRTVRAGLFSLYRPAPPPAPVDPAAGK